MRPARFQIDECQRRREVGSDGMTNADIRPRKRLRDFPSEQIVRNSGEEPGGNVEAAECDRRIQTGAAGVGHISGFAAPRHAGQHVYQRIAATQDHGPCYRPGLQKWKSPIGDFDSISACDPNLRACFIVFRRSSLSPDRHGAESNRLNMVALSRHTAFNILKQIFKRSP